MNIIRCILISATLALVAACANEALPNKNAFKPTPLQFNSNGMLYIYRPEASSPGVAKPLRFSYPEVLVDEKSVGVIEYDSYISVELPPGKHTVRLTGLTERAKDWEARDINRSVNITSGASSYLRFKVEFDVNNMMIFQPKPQYMMLLTPVDAGSAIYEIRYTSPMK